MPFLWVPALATLLSAQPPELGLVQWGRDLDAATATARATGRPLLVLFDEVPGCSTVLGFGRTVLSHPDIVAVIEAETVAVAVYNNVDGADRRWLASFSEPTWNNPVVRIMDAERRPWAPRYAGPYTVKAFARVLSEALVAAGRAPPERLLRLAHEPVEAKAILAMGCFWEGEAQLGALDGVRAARVGFLGGDEVVEVSYDPSVIDRRTLLEKARAAGVASRVYAADEAEAAVARAAGIPVQLTREALRPSPKDSKYYLARSGRSTVGLDEEAALKLNSALRLGRDVGSARR
jgi:hypothetical protein